MPPKESKRAAAAEDPPGKKQRTDAAPGPGPAAAVHDAGAGAGVAEPSTPVMPEHVWIFVVVASNTSKGPYRAAVSTGYDSMKKFRLDVANPECVRFLMSMEPRVFNADPGITWDCVRTEAQKAQLENKSRTMTDVLRPGGGLSGLEFITGPECTSMEGRAWYRENGNRGAEGDTAETWLTLICSQPFLYPFNQVRRGFVFDEEVELNPLARHVERERQAERAAGKAA